MKPSGCRLGGSRWLAVLAGLLCTITASSTLLVGDGATIEQALRKSDSDKLAELRKLIAADYRMAFA
jgi:hypothetical protein